MILCKPEFISIPGLTMPDCIVFGRRSAEPMPVARVLKAVGSCVPYLKLGAEVRPLLMPPIVGSVIVTDLTCFCFPVES